MDASFSDSSKQEVPRTNEDEDEHKEREKETANYLLALELHW
jgi:hypothetical protein